MQPGAPQQPQQQPQQHITRRYLTDAQYTADAARMATAGWRVSALSRDVATNQIIAEYVAPSAPRPPLPPLDRRMFFLGAGVGGILLLVLLAALIVAQLHAAAAQLPSDGLATPTANVNAAATILAHDATAAPSSPAPSSPAPMLISPVAGPQLGGPWAAFDRAYGPEVSQGFWNITLAGQPVQMVIAGNRAGESADGQLRAAVIDLIGPDSAHPWSTAQEAALTGAFLPPDARHTKEVAGSDAHGPDHLYTSQQLAAAFVASIFQDANNQQLAPGTFDWQCSTDRQLCEVGVGTNS